MFLPMNFFTPKLMKLDGLLFSLGLLHITFYIKLSKHGSNLNSIFVIMNELKLQHYGPCKLFEKNQKNYTFRISDCSGHIEGDMMKNHEQKNE
jgi:hypothetical protein